MAKKIEWLENFAESYAKEMKKTAGKIQKEDLIVDRDVVKGAKVGDTVKFQGRLYKVADLEFEDEKGPGVVLNEVGPETPAAPAGDAAMGYDNPTDPMAVSMGANPATVSNNTGAQEYARTNPGDVYHYEVRDQVEQPAFEQAAAETAAEIEKERAFDRSTVPGHYTAPKNMGGAAPVAPAAPAADVAPMGDAPVVEETVEEVPTEEVSMDAPVEEVPEVEETEEVEVPVDGEEEVVEETEEVPAEDEEDKAPVAARYNRILRRIMASK